jgi:cyclopropane-fatty-acyl-phospholipid synthase
MPTLLQRAFAPFIRRGTLRVRAADGSSFTLGDGGCPRVAIRFTDLAAQRWLLVDPELKLGELFADGRLVVEEGSIYELFQLALQDSHGDRDRLPVRAAPLVRALFARFGTRNDARRSRRNVAHHYDLDGAFYSLFLDPDRQYSCAYFERPGMSLEAAQLAKKRHVAAKLLVEPGHSVLDIGSGWGGLALYLAQVAGAGRVRGVTLSTEQLAYANRRAADEGLDGPVAFALEDYRTTRGPFDRVVSVGMFEHVGVADYDAYFGGVARLLAEDGVALVHTIGRTGPPAYLNPWMAKYVFPGGHLPTLSEIEPAVERAGLVLCDVEVLRLHYADTLRAWRERFLARRAEAVRLTDERFCRLWECYLAMAEAAFRFEDLVVFQLQFARRNDVVPLTRGYIAEREARLRAAEVRLEPACAAAGC